ncbi:hypothetical protein [Cribrihabitans neustonicus]|uniref:hypothetical protein n=1 Tax=Cribrihabitans neustonicus TaxID=1429085 RepID=UPI003B5B51AB
MSWVVDQPVRAGPRAFAAVSRVCLRRSAAGGRLACCGEKRPLLILEFDDGAVRGIGLDGRSYTAPEAEALFPQAIARARELLEEQAARPD